MKQRARGKERKGEGIFALPALGTLAFLFLLLPHLSGTNDWRFAQILLAAILAGGFGVVVWQIWRKKGLALSFPERVLCAFVGWQWLTLLWSVYRWASWLEASRWTAFAVLVLALRRLGAEDRQRILLSAAFVASAFVTTVQGLADYALNAVVGNPAWRIFGPFLQPNLFGNYLLLAFFLAVSIAFERPRNWVFLSVLGALMIWVAMTLTGSKGALLAWLAGTALFSLLAVRQQLPTFGQQGRWMTIALLLGTMVLVFLAALALPPLRTRFETLLTAQAHSWMFRLFVWQATLRGMAERPLTGFGAGTFEWVYPQFTSVGFTRHAHNGFLQLGIESGFIGLGLLILFFVSLFVEGARDRGHRVQSAGKRTGSWVRIGSLAAIFAFCCHNLMETAWMTSANLLSLAAICGLAIANGSTEQGAQQRWQWQIPAALALLAGLWHAISVALGAHYAQRAQMELLPSTRLYWLEQASLVDPLNARWKLDCALMLEAWARATGDEQRLRQALRLCDTVIRLQPTRSGNYKVKARLLQAMGNEQGAERALLCALRLGRTDTEAMLRLGELLEQQGRTAEAIRWYRRLVALERGAYGRYKPVEQWQDIFLAAGKVRLAKLLLRQGKGAQAQQLAQEAETMLERFLSDYLPILKASEPEVAKSQEAFVQSVLSEAKSLHKRKGG